MPPIVSRPLRFVSSNTPWLPEALLAVVATGGSPSELVRCLHFWPNMNPSVMLVPFAMLIFIAGIMSDALGESDGTYMSISVGSTHLGHAQHLP